MARKIKNPEPHWLNQKNCARSLDMTPAAFARWNVPHVAVIGGEKYYTLKDVVETKFQRLDKRKASTTSRQEALEQIDAAKLQEITERTENIALKNAIVRREYAPISVLEWALGRVGAQVAAILESIPVKLKRRCPSLTTAELQMVKEEIIKCQNIASEIHLDLDEYESGS